MRRERKKPSKDGLRRLMRRVNTQGIQVVDRRSAAYRTVREWREELLTAFGGEAEISPQRLTLIDLLVRTRLYLDHCDGFILSQKTLVKKRSKTLIPIVLQRQQLADSLQKTLVTLGLDRLPKPTPSLAEVLRRREVGETALTASEEAERPATERQEEHSS